MSKDNMLKEDSQTSEYLVCFYDVLGQKEWMKTAVKDCAVIPGKQDELNRIASLTMTACQKIRDAISRFSKENSIRLIKGKDYGVQQFSDSTVIYVRKSIELAPRLFYEVLLDVSCHILESQAEGLGIRGGVTIGLVWPVAGGTFCGPALDEVSNLECKTAFWQRIVVSDRYVQWIGKEMVDDGISDKRKEGLSDLNSLLRWGVDTECYLNVFNSAVACRMDSDAGYEKYKCVYNAAWKMVNETLWSSKKPYVWKYFFTEDTYDYRKKASAEVPRDNGFHDDKDSALENVNVGRYFVCYLKLLPLSLIPKDKELIETGYCNLGYSHSNATTIMLLQCGMANLMAWRRECSKRHPDVETGIQQIGNYVLIYVKDDIAEAYLAFVEALHVVEIFKLLALHAQHFMTGAIAIGCGWTLAKDCLCGPVVGEVDSLATKNVPYPRIVISSDMVDSMHRRLICGTGLKFDGRVHEDIDGCWIWDDFAEMSKRQDIAGIEIKVYMKEVLRHYMFRHLVMWHFRHRNNEGSAFARQMHLATRRLMGIAEELEWKDLYDEAEKLAIEDLKTIEPLEAGTYPWILCRYIGMPIFEPRIGSSAPWINFASAHSIL